MLRVAFAGTPEFALPTLQALAASAHRLVGVLTQPDRPAGRGRALQASPVKQLALQLSLPVAQPQRLRTAEQRAALAAWAPDVLVVAAYGLILPPEALALPRLGCINVHASLLPRWRGAAPIQHAILAGDAETGVTIMQMDAGLDTGPVLAMRRVPLGEDLTAAALQAQLSQLGAALLCATLDGLEAGQPQPQPQAAQGVTHAPKIDKAMAQLDWDAAAVELARRVRAFNPRPVAQTSWQGTQLRVWEAHALAATAAADPAAHSGAAAGTSGTASSEPAAAGTVLRLADEALWVQCGQGVLALTRLQLAGRRVVSARELAGSTALIGTRLGG